MIRLRVLGSLELTSDSRGQCDAVLAQPKRAALLAYLAAASPSGFHRRDRLLALLWPESDGAHARAALNTAIAFLRRELGRDAIVNRGGEEIGLESGSVWTDVNAFRAALDSGHYAEALSLYRGDFLDGFFANGSALLDEWVDRTRVQLRANAAHAARSLAEQREQEQNFTTAVSCARRAVELSDADERVFRELLEMLARLGDRAGAVLAFERFERGLAENLGVEPSAETRAVIDRIRDRDPDEGVSASTSHSPREPSRAGLGNWEIERELGRGGMATVYLARDAAHDRYVALKVMRPELTLSSGVERFLREIQINARLAHPHILPLIDSGTREGAPYLVTPYVAGESLRERLSREGALPLADALRVAIEIAEALDYAHRSGIVHCDVKPENVLLADGHAVVADFGVARAVDASRGGDPTHAGEIVGSRRYMSAEQAAGAADVGPQSDIFSFGCVMLEMLSGAPPREGEVVAARLADRRDVPIALQKLVAECMSSRPDERPLTAASVLRRLQGIQPFGGAAQRRRRWWLIPSFAAGIVAVAIASSAAFARDKWNSVTAGSTKQLTNSPGLELDPAISPDGQFIAYSAGNADRMRIYVRPISGGNAIAVSGELMRVHRWPSWSPDGSHIAFLAADRDQNRDGARVFIVPALGGSPRLIAENLTDFSTPAWSPRGDRIAYALRDSIVLRDTMGVQILAFSARLRSYGDDAAKSSSAWAIHSLAWSPDGRRLAFISGNSAYVFGGTSFGNLGPSSIWTIALDGSAPNRVTFETSTYTSPVWTPDGHGMLYASNTDGAWDAYYQKLNRNARPSGSARRLTTGLNAHGIGLSRDGSRLAFSLMNYRSNIFTAPIITGQVTPSTAVHAITDDNQTIETVDVSPDGKWLAFESNRDGRAHIYKMPVVGGEIVQLTRGRLEDFAPKWSPDGGRIAFHSREPSKDGLRDVYVMNADGSGRTRITSDSLDDAYPVWLGTDGSRLTYANKVATLSADGGWSTPRVDSTLSNRPLVSADGRYRVYRKAGDMYSVRDHDAPRRIVSADGLGGRIAAITPGRDPTVVYFRLIDSLGVHSIYSVPVASGSPRLITRLEATRREPARVLLSAGEGQLFFTLTQAQSDIWTVELKRQ